MVYLPVPTQRPEEQTQTIDQMAEAMMASMKSMFDMLDEVKRDLAVQGAAERAAMHVPGYHCGL